MFLRSNTVLLTGAFEIEFCLNIRFINFLGYAESMPDAIFSYQDNIPRQSCLRCHYLKGKGHEHIHVSWP